MRRIVVAITGASGATYGIELVRNLSTLNGIETHLIVSAAGYLTIASELNLKRSEIDSLADVVYSDRDIGATIASGSFNVDSMIIAPCSMKSLASIATGLSGTLVSRAADVALKERRRLVMLVRETPLNLIHLRNMTTVTEMGGVIFPPVPAFYAKPKTIEDLVSNTIGRVLECCNIENRLQTPWSGVSSGPV